MCVRHVVPTSNIVHITLSSLQLVCICGDRGSSTFRLAEAARRVGNVGQKIPQRSGRAIEIHKKQNFPRCPLRLLPTHFRAVEIANALNSTFLFACHHFRMSTVVRTTKLFRATLHLGHNRSSVMPAHLVNARNTASLLAHTIGSSPVRSEVLALLANLIQRPATCQVCANTLSFSRRAIRGSKSRATDRRCLLEWILGPVKA